MIRRYWNARIFALIFCLCAAAVLPACASKARVPEQAEKTGIVLEGVVIRNDLLFPVTEVMIIVPATGAFAGCGNIMPRSECRTSFETVDYRANALLVRWKEYGKPHQTDEFVIAVPENLDRHQPAWLEVIIFAMGQAGARLVQ